MPVAAFYARKSTEEDVTDGEKSVSRQIELALACARKHGLEVPSEHIYVGDAISVVVRDVAGQVSLRRGEGARVSRRTAPAVTPAPGISP